MRQVIPDVYQVPFMAGFLNIYLVYNGDSVIMIDTGMSPGHIERVGRDLEHARRSLDDVKHILVTHAHPDHVGGLTAAQGQTSAQTYAHAREAHIIQGEQAPVFADRSNLSGLAWLMSFYFASYNKPTDDPARVDVEVQDGDTLDDVLPGLQVVELPGHAYGQVGYWWPEHKLLFGGDVMTHLPWGLRMPPRAPTPDWEAARRSIQRVAEMDVEILCLGHGAPIVGDAKSKIRAFAPTAG